MEIVIIILAVGAILGTGIIILLWLWFHKKQREDLGQVVDRIESTQHQFFSDVRDAIEHEKLISIVTAFSTMLSQSLDIKQIIQTAISMVKEVMKVDIVLVFSLIEETQELELVAYEGVDSKYALAVGRMKLGEGFCGRVASTGKPIVVRDLSADRDLGSPAAREENIKAQASVPLQSRGKIIGTLCAATKGLQQFSHIEIELLIAIGNLVGIAMENSQLYREKVTAAERYRVSEEKYRQLFESAHDAIWVQDLSGKITAANEAAAQLFGCTLPELIGTDSKQFLSHEESNLSEEIQDWLLHGQEVNQPYTQKFVRKDGSGAVLTITTNLISSDNQPDGFQFIARDRTKEIRMQENQSFYLKQITQAHEEERQRIARDLHDSSAQGLIHVLHQMREFCQTDECLPKSRSELLWNYHAQLHDILQEIRQLSRDLRPSILDDFGLLPAVEWLTEQLKTEQNLVANMVVSGEEKRFSPETEIALFRIVQEALRNIVKHAGATKAQVTIEFKNTETKIMIADNGKGFELPASLGELSRLGKLGIDGMQTRARLIGGMFNAHSSKDEGTVITVTVPA